MNKTWKLRFKILFIAITFGILSWIADAIVDYLFFFNTSFNNVLLFHLSSHMQFERIMIIITFLIFGIYVSHLVVKKRNVEENLKDSEERFKLVADFAKDWEYWITKGRKLNYISPSAERITGYKPKEFLKNKQLLENIIHPDDRDKFIQHTHESLCEADLESFEFRIITKDEKTVWIEHSCQSVYDSKNNYLGHRASNRDITRRKIAEEMIISSRNKLEELVKERTNELEKSNNDLHTENLERKKVEKEILEKNEFLNTTINSLTHPFYVLDANDYTVVLSNTATKEFVSTINPKCYAVTHKRSKPCEEEHNCPLEIVKKTKKQTTVEHVHYDKFGKPRVFEVHGHPIFDKDGNVIQMIEYSIDITKRKMLESRVLRRTKEVKSLLEQSPSAIGVHDNAGKLLEVNDEWKNLFNHNGSKKISQNLWENEYLISAGFKQNVNQIIKKGGRLKTEPIYLEKENKIVVFDIYDIKDEEGNVNRIVCQIEDRTDEMKREDINRELNLQKRISRAVLDILEEDRKRVSKELHDQIGQKLLLAKLGIEVLQEEKGQKNPKLEEAKNQIVGISKEIKSIILSLHPAELDNYGLIDAVQMMVNNFSTMMRIQISLDFYGSPKSLNKKLELNIYRIVQEGLNNISKHAKAKSVSIELKFNDEYIKGKVTDDGIGFDMKKLDSGTLVDVGYGLISMRERVKISDGEFSMFSKPGEGTEINFEIPLVEQHDE